MRESILFAFLFEFLKFLVSMGLLFGLLHKILDGLTLHNLINAKDLIKIFLKLLPALFNILRTLIGNPKNLFLRKLWSTYIHTKLHILNLALNQRIMHIPQLTIPRLKRPLLMRVQVPHPHVIYHHIVDQCIAVNAYLHVELFCVRGHRLVFLVRNVIFFQHLQAVQLLNRQQVRQIL